MLLWLGMFFVVLFGCLLVILSFFVLCHVLGRGILVLGVGLGRRLLLVILLVGLRLLFLCCCIVLLWLVLVLGIPIFPTRRASYLHRLRFGIWV